MLALDELRVSEVSAGALLHCANRERRVGILAR
jgi:hypothetical protein